MKKLGWPYKQTMEYVRKQRWVTNPNPGFVKQLKHFEQYLKLFENPETPSKNEKGFNTSGLQLTSGKTSLGGPRGVSSLMMNSRVGGVRRERSVRVDGKNTCKLQNYSLVKR